MAVRGNGKGARPTVALFHDNLMSNASSGRTEDDTLFLGEVFDLTVLVEVCFALAADIAIERYDDPLLVTYLRRSDGKKLGGNGPRVVI